MTDPQPWWELPLLGFDLETTGPDPERCGIVTANVSLVQPDGTHTGRTLEIDPGVEIPAGAAAVHGYTTERIREVGMQRTFGLGVLYGIFRTVLRTGAPLVIFNAAFDLTVLERELRRENLPMIELPAIIDPFVLDKTCDKYRRGKRTLGVCAEHYGVELVDAHTAAADVIAAVGVARAIGRKYRSVLPADASRAHGLSIMWYRQQAESLEQYRRANGDRDFTASKLWPLNALAGREPYPLEAE